MMLKIVKWFTLIHFQYLPISSMQNGSTPVKPGGHLQPAPTHSSGFKPPGRELEESVGVE